MSETPESPEAAPAAAEAPPEAPPEALQDEGAAEAGAVTPGDEGDAPPAEGIRAKRPARRRRRQRDRFFSRRKVSRLTTEPGLAVDYKNISLLRTFLSPEGKILPRRITGNTAKQQRQVAEAVKRARHLALLPYEPSEH